MATVTPPRKPQKANDNIKVVVRVRPILDSELSRGEVPQWITTPHTIRQREFTLEKDRNRRLAQYAFDHVFESVPTDDLYDNVGEAAILSAMEGYNATIFAYGQTASGKTYTMKGVPEDPGMVPMALTDVFSYIEECPGREFLLRMSYMEIYNELVHDLLDASNVNLKIREEKKRGVYVEGLKEQVVASLDHVMGLIQSGEAYRHVGRTNYNEVSSRSHSILQLTIESRESGHTPKGTPVSTPLRARTPSSSSHLLKPGAAGHGADAAIRVSVLSLIDLAGSEKVVDDQDRRKEGGYINRSLLTLGNVISRLSEDKGNGYIPYRDSKLTRILQNSLTGNAKIVVICTLNPTVHCFDESNKTLMFAQRAKKISTDPHINEMTGETVLLQQYRNQIRELTAQLEALSMNMNTPDKQEVERLRQEKELVAEELREKDALIPVLRDRVNHLMSVILTSRGHSRATAPREEEVMESIRTQRHILHQSGGAGTGVQALLTTEPQHDRANQEHEEHQRKRMSELKKQAAESNRLAGALAEKEFELEEKTAIAEMMEDELVQYKAALQQCLALLAQHNINTATIQLPPSLSEQ